jgi:hypothetical protein
LSVFAVTQTTVAEHSTSACRTASLDVWKVSGDQRKDFAGEALIAFRGVIAVPNREADDGHVNVSFTQRAIRASRRCRYQRER